MESLKQLKDILSDVSNENILIIPHNMPDGDTLGSCLAVYHLTKYYQKKGYIVLDDVIPSNLLFLFESVKCYKKEEVQNVTFDVAIAVDCGEVKLFEDRFDLYNRAKYRINIDHHKTNSFYGDLNIVDAQASSTGELVYTIFDNLRAPINSKIGEALYAAIVTDTGSFRYSNTRPLTFSICKTLQETGFDFNRLNVEIFQNKTYEKLLLLNKVFDTLKIHANGKFGVVKMSQELIENLNLSEYDTDGIVEFVRDIKGIEIVAFIRYIGGGAHKVSMRAKHNADVSVIAQKFNGGGHTKAAGFKTTLSIDEIEAQLIGEVEYFFNQASELNVVPEINGVIVIHKPQHMTSHDVVAILRKKLRTRKIGHTGTLDPMATGVLPICIGKSTKIVDFLMGCKKTYRCEMKLGSATDTQDCWGSVVETKECLDISDIEIMRIIQSFIGDIDQIPPMYSALKINGEKLVDLARQGIEIERESRVRTIYSIDNIDIRHHTISFDVTCSKGTYIRTLCHDIGLKLGCFAHMTSLVRLSSEPFSIEQAVTIEEISLDNIHQHLISTESALDFMESVVIQVDEKMEKLIENGVKVDLRRFVKKHEYSEGFYRMYINNLFWGIAEMCPEGFLMRKIMKD